MSNKLVIATTFLCALCITTITSDVFAQDGWGNLKGKIIVKGDVPGPVKLNVDKDKAVCLKDGPLERQEVIVGSEGELQHAFVMMYFGRRDKEPTVHPKYEEQFKTAVVLDNVTCRFDPTAVFIRKGQDIVLKNSDAIGHSCKFESLNNDQNFNIPPNGKLTVQLDGIDKVPGNLVCGMHSWMSAVFLVRDEPYAAITGKDGTFEITDIPAGKWKFQFWHKKSGYMRAMTKDGEEILGRRGEIEIEIKPGETYDFGTLIFDAGEFK